MYKIIDTEDGATIGSAERLLFIRKKEATGCFVSTTAKEAQGIAFQGIPYNLQGRNGVGAEKTVLVVEFDLGTIADKTDENSAAIDNIIISMLEA